MNPLDTQRLQDWALGMAKHVALLSKDPSTQVGAVIFDPKRRLISAGYNGFARGVRDTKERLDHRETKYKLILHAEKNAIMFATAPLDDCTMVVTHPCCAQCAALAIRSGDQACDRTPNPPSSSSPAGRMTSPSPTNSFRKPV